MNATYLLTEIRRNFRVTHNRNPALQQQLQTLGKLLLIRVHLVSQHAVLDTDRFPFARRR